MARQFLLGAALLAQLITPTLAVTALETHESLLSLPSGWTHAGKVDANTPIQLSISLALRNIDQVEDNLRSISTPGSSSYGQYLDAADVDLHFGPADSAAVIRWLKEAGIEHIHDAGQSVNFATPISKANSLLNADFNQYSDGAVFKLRTQRYSIPGDLKAHIDIISPTTYFGKSSAQHPVKAYKSKRSAASTTSSSGSSSSSTSVAGSCQTSLTPSCAKKLYNVGKYTPSIKSGSRIGFGSFLNGSALYLDLATYEHSYGIPAQNWTKVIIANASNSQDPSSDGFGEANLDVQNIVGISHPLLVTEFLTSGSP